VTYASVRQRYAERVATMSSTAELDAPSPWTETFSAAFSLQRREENFVSRDNAMREPMQARADLMIERGADPMLASAYLAMPQSLRDDWLEHYRSTGGDMKSAPGWRAMEFDAIGQQWQSAFMAARSFEDQYTDVPTDEQMLEDFAKQSAELRQQEQSTMQRGSGLATFAGQMAGVMTDPPVLGSMLLGTPASMVAGRSVLAAAGRVAAVEGAIGVASEIPIQAAVLQFKRDIDAPWTLRESVINVLAAGAGGAVLGGAMSAAAPAARGLATRSRDVLDAYKLRRDLIETRVDRATIERLDSAAEVLEDVVAIEEANPLQPVPAAMDAHEMALELARMQDETGLPVNVSEVVAGLEPEPAPLEAALARATGAEQPATAPGEPAAAADGLIDVDPRQVQVDARTFQFKAGSDAEGVIDTLRDVQQFDRRLAGVSLIWERADGVQFIADGHQRRALAMRALEAGQPEADVRLNGFVLREADGITAAQARSAAAVKNIAEGTGTAIDAAKILREVGELGAAQLPPLPPRSALVRQARGLAKLTDDNFMAVVNDVIDPRYGALVGDAAADGQLQQAMIQVLARTQPANETQARSIVDQVRTQGIEVSTTEDLFGETSIAESLYLERAQVLDAAMREARKDRATFGRLVSEQERIAEAGNTLDADANQARMEDARNAIARVSALANTRGPVSDALTDAARRVKQGERPAAVTADFLATARRAITDGDSIGRTTGAPRSASEAPADVAPSADGFGAQVLDTAFDTTTEGFSHKVLIVDVWRAMQRRHGASVSLDEFKQRILTDPDIVLLPLDDPTLVARDLAQASEIDTGIERLHFIERPTASEVRAARKLLQPTPTDVAPEPAAPRANEALALAEVQEYGITFRTGEPVTFDYARNTEPAPRAGPDDTFQQNIEPAGRYVVHVPSNQPTMPNQQRGSMTLNRPMVVELNTGTGRVYDGNSWKAQLESVYGKRGAALSRAILDDGYDGIVTVETTKRGPQTAEIVDLRDVAPEPAAPRDLLGDDTRAAQAIADETRARDAARNEGQESVETGDAGDLFSQARNQDELFPVDQPTRSVVREAVDEQAGTPSGTRTGTVDDADYLKVMREFENLANDMGEQAKVLTEVDGELIQVSGRTAIEELDNAERAIEAVRICNMGEKT
jgi:hypothetical protein